VSFSQCFARTSSHLCS